MRFLVFPLFCLPFLDWLLGFLIRQNFLTLLKFVILILDIRERIFTDPHKVLDHINVRFNDKASVKINFKEKQYAKIVRLNHPNNCLTMDIGSLIEDLRGIKQIQFNFHQLTDYKIEVKIEDRQYSLSRTFRNNKFGNIGPRLFLESLEKRILTRH